MSNPLWIIGKPTNFITCFVCYHVLNNVRIPVIHGAKPTDTFKRQLYLLLILRGSEENGIRTVNARSSECKNQKYDGGFYCQALIHGTKLSQL